MFSDLEIHKVSNGYVVMVRSEETDEVEFVFDSHNKVLRFIKQMLTEKTPTGKKTDE